MGNMERMVLPVEVHIRNSDDVERVSDTKSSDIENEADPFGVHMFGPLRPWPSPIILKREEKNRTRRLGGIVEVVRIHISGNQEVKRCAVCRRVCKSEGKVSEITPDKAV